MKKSGLADSPFFAPTQPMNEVATPPSSLEPDKSKVGEKLNSIPDSPIPEKTDTAISQVQIAENQDQKRSFDRTFARPNERSNERLNERPPKKKREKIRHTFDIYRDQLVALQM